MIKTLLLIGVGILFAVVALDTSKMRNEAQEKVIDTRENVISHFTDEFISFW